MSLLDKKLYLADLEEKLGAVLPAAQARRVAELAGEALAGYDLSALPDPGGHDDESEGLLKIYIDAKKIEGRSPLTVKRYEQILRRLRTDVGVPYSRMTVHHLRGWLMGERDRGVELSTCEGMRYILTAFFGWCWKEELIGKNPSANLAPIKAPKVIRKPFSGEEIEKLRAACRTQRERALVCTLLSTGCRVSEICALDVLDVDFRDKRITVMGKGSKQRVVYLDDAAALHLDRYLSDRCDASPALFTGQRGRMTDAGVRTLLGEIAQRAGVENVHPHRFRRTLATGLIDRGMAIQEVAQILGHDKIDTTMTYIYVDQAKVETAFRRYA